MRVTILTNTAPQHLHLCCEIAREFEVAAIVHPAASDAGKTAAARRAWRRLRSRGATYMGLGALARVLPAQLVGWRFGGGRDGPNRLRFPDVRSRYEQVAARMPVHRGVRVNEPEGIRIIRDIDADVVVNLGGDIYGSECIQATRLMLNYHAGVSPLYNGTCVTDFAFSNGHAHLCGGTLMTMVPEIDGGIILAHHFPALGRESTPASTFVDTVAAAPAVYSSFLRHLAAHGRYSGVPQGPALHHFHGFQWTLARSVETAFRLRKGLPGWQHRAARTTEYFPLPDDAVARAAFEREMTRLILGDRQG